jgi:hypothetical protein
MSYDTLTARDLLKLLSGILQTSADKIETDPGERSAEQCVISTTAIWANSKSAMTLSEVL